MPLLLSIRSATIGHLALGPSIAASAASALDNCGDGVARILVVDDFEDLVVTMSSLLESFGHDLRTAANGREAFEAARDFVPEIIFMDLDMPVMTGFESARLICSELPIKPFLVAVTATATAGVDAATKAVGFDLCLRKPAEAGVLLALVEMVARNEA